MPCHDGRCLLISYAVNLTCWDGVMAKEELCVRDTFFFSILVQFGWSSTSNRSKSAGSMRCLSFVWYYKQLEELQSSRQWSGLAYVCCQYWLPPPMFGLSVGSALFYSFPPLTIHLWRSADARGVLLNVWLGLANFVHHAWHHQMALKEEFDRNENVYKVVAMQEAEERRLRDRELERMRVQWLEQMKVLLPYG